MNSSIVSYPNRGHWGKSSWRGNTSGYVVRELLRFFEPRLFVDPMCGSNTSGDVAREMAIEYVGLDLHSGFNILKDSLTARLGARQADYVFLHPPYHDMIRYSGEVYGTQAHPDDLSRCASYEEFLTKMQMALLNVYEALRRGGHYSILIGDLRRRGEYISIQSDLLQLAPGALESIIIKAQHNMMSNYRHYAGAFIPVTHEYLLNFRKNALFFAMLDETLDVDERLAKLARANWKAILLRALNQLGGSAKLADIYHAVEREAGAKTKARPNWQARVRAELQRCFERVERGVWALPQAA